MCGVRRNARWLDGKAAHRCLGWMEGGGGKSTSAGDEEVHGGEAAHASSAEQPPKADTKQGGTAMRNATCAPEKRSRTEQRLSGWWIVHEDARSCVFQSDFSVRPPLAGGDG